MEVLRGPFPALHNDGIYMLFWILYNPTPELPTMNITLAFLCECTEYVLADNSRLFNAQHAQSYARWPFVKYFA